MDRNHKLDKEFYSFQQNKSENTVKSNKCASNSYIN